MVIINFYEKYGISQNEKLEKIQWKINQKLVDELNDTFSPGHFEKLHFLELAKVVFASIESKVQYDKDLANSMLKKDPESDKKAAFEKWYGDAQTHYRKAQYDYAKQAIDFALQYLTSDINRCSFYCNAARIYTYTSDYSGALDFATKAIVFEPNNCRGYSVKMFVLNEYILDSTSTFKNLQKTWQQLKDTIMEMIKIAKSSNLNYEAAKGYALLAKMYYKYVDGRQYPLSGNDNVLAEKYANEAVTLLESGQVLSDASNVLNDISSRRAEISRLKKINLELDKQNSTLQSDITSLKKSINNVTTYGSTNWGAEYFWLLILVFFGILGIMIIFVVLGMKAISFEKNNRIKDTLDLIRNNESKIRNNIYQIEKNTESITLQGKGIALHPQNFKSLNVSKKPI